MNPLQWIHSLACQIVLIETYHYELTLRACLNLTHTNDLN